MGKVDDALSFASVARELIPQNQHFYLYPIQVLIQFNRAKEAFDLLESSKEFLPIDLFETFRYFLLHKLGRVIEARDYCLEILKNDRDKKLDLFADVAKAFYSKEDRQTSISIYQQLLSIEPENIRVSNNLGYMLMSEGDFNAAESLFSKVIEKNIKDEHTFISRLNFAYIYSIQGEHNKAFQLTDEVLNSEYASIEATLHIPVFFAGKVHPDPVKFPGRSLKLETAALGCNLASALAIDDFNRADDFFKSLLSGKYEDTMPLVCLGSLEAGKGNIEEAKRAWNQVINFSKNEDEKNILKDWTAEID